MLLLEKLISLYAPHCCVGCGIEADTLLCPACRDAAAPIPSRCYRCRAATRGCAVCESCRTKTPLRRVLVCAHYDGVMKELLHHAKYERARSGLYEIATLMSGLLAQETSDIVLVPVPTASSRVRQRGYDQAEVLAKQLAQQNGMTYASHLIRVGQAHQVGANRKARLAHLEGAFRVSHSQSLKDKHVMLVDDVVTTGATIEAAARLLKRAGAKQVDAIVFCQAS